jgi:hypothetical protein
LVPSPFLNPNPDPNLAVELVIQPFMASINDGEKDEEEEEEEEVEEG